MSYKTAIERLIGVANQSSILVITAWLSSALGTEDIPYPPLSQRAFLEDRVLSSSPAFDGSHEGHESGSGFTVTKANRKK
jgi:hypothetical protein